jgi:AhpD family alkylhydroperoxidase
MQPRLDYRKAAPEAFRAMLALDRVTGAESGLPPRLVHLVKVRASQINGCAFCVDMHVKEARQDGETQQRLDLLCVWRETPVFTDEERALLAWVEAVTRIADGQAPDEVFLPLRRFFSDEQIAKLTFAIVTINAWNRLAVSFRSLHPVDPPAAK